MAGALCLENQFGMEWAERTIYRDFIYVLGVLSSDRAVQMNGGNAVRQTELGLGQNYDNVSGDDVCRPEFILGGNTESCFQQW